MKIVFIQFSDLIDQDTNPVRGYYTDVHGEHYNITTKHWLEPPHWISILAGMLRNYEYEVEVVTNVKESASHLLNMSNDCNGKITYMMSAMDANKHHVKKLTEYIQNHGTVIVGGYIDKAYLYGSGARWINDITELKRNFFRDIDLMASPDYTSLWNYGVTLPRLAMSEGCKFNCNFCTIPKTITHYTEEAIMGQAESFKPLRFTHVYVSDKTFGQAGNSGFLGHVNDYIKQYNRVFEGFIVQTTATMITKKNLHEWYKNGVRVIEIGIESADQKILESLRKPFGVKHINKAMDLIREDGRFLFVPNLIFGIPNDDYEATIDYVNENVDIITFINPYVLCTYHDAKGQVAEHHQDSDSNEQTLEKSWMSDEFKVETNRVMHRLLNYFGVFRGF